jgi:GDPmannose 4,6-dehydratase
MWLMLQQKEPVDYVIATGSSYSVRDFVECSFAHVGLDWREHVRFDERYLRPSEVDDLVGDASKAAHDLGWRPTVRAPELARLMTDAELDALPRGDGAAAATVPAPAQALTAHGR